MTGKVLNVGIGGTGIFATESHLPTIQSLSKKFKAVACFNRTKAKAEEFAEKASINSSNVYDSLDDILNDPEVDVVDVLLPVQFNYDAISKAVKAGKPIMIEKPIAATLEDARKIVELDRSTDVPIQISENWLFLQSVELIKERLPKIGDIVSFTYRSTGPFNRNNKYMSTTWRQNPEHIGGFLSDGGVHQIALLTAVLGEVKSVSALTKQVHKESGADDILFSTLRLKHNNAIGTFTYGSAFGSIEKHGSFIIYGTHGSITYEFSAGKPRSLKLVVGSYADDGKLEEEFEIDEDKVGLVSEFENFYEAVSKKDKSLLIATPEKTFHHLAFIGAALESSKKDGDHVDVLVP